MGPHRWIYVWQALAVGVVFGIILFILGQGLVYTLQYMCDAEVVTCGKIYHR